MSGTPKAPPASDEVVYRVVREADPQAVASVDHLPADSQWLSIDHFHPDSSEHRPVTQAALGVSPRALLLWFRVQDRFVLARRQGYQQDVCRDSCVEFFFQPAGQAGYFNVEINCGGAILLKYNLRPRQSEPLPTIALDEVQIETTLPPRIDPELSGPTTWLIACTLPLDVLRPYLPETVELPPPPGATWRGNFYKCGDETSHPHWGSWSPIGKVKDFHQPQQFGTLRFD